MKNFYWFLLLPALLLVHPGRAQAPAGRLVVVHPSVGEVIDKAEKARYGLLMFYAADDFVEARFYRALTPDSAITLHSQLRTGPQVRSFTRAEFAAMREAIEGRNRELGLSGAAPAANAPASNAPAQGTSEFIGRTYSVELVSGNTLIGVLQSTSETELEFQTKGLGTVRIQRSNLRQMVALTAQQALKGYEDVGNGTRIFFSPTARNLRKGEGYLQNIDIILMGVNYGITDNFSIGTLFTFIPELGSDNLFAITPKLSFPLNDRVHVGGGLLMFFIAGTTAGITYANATYGSADHNLTGGLGYAFVGGEYASTPVFMLGGATRVSRRLSLLNETYILHVSDSDASYTGVAGIAGIRIAAQRFSGNIGLVYSYAGYSDAGGSDNTGLDVVPGYAELVYRFGKIKPPTKQ